MISIISAEDFRKKEVTVKMMVDWFNENCREEDKVKQNSWRTRQQAINCCTALMKIVDDEIRLADFTSEIPDDKYFEFMQAPHLTEKELLALNSDPYISKEDWLARMTPPAGFDPSKPVSDVEPSKGNPPGLPSSSLPSGRRLSSNSLGIAESWKDEDVKRARTTRHRVEVIHDDDTMDFKSTKAAFDYYGLPDAKHIRFRMKLKASGFEVFIHDGKEYQFRIAGLETKAL